MENDEFESNEARDTEDAAEKKTSEPGPDHPKEYRFDDWALI